VFSLQNEILKPFSYIIIKKYFIYVETIHLNWPAYELFLFPGLNITFTMGFCERYCFENSNKIRPLSLCNIKDTILGPREKLLTKILISGIFK